VNPELPIGDYAGYLAYTRARVLFADATLASRAQDVIGAAAHLGATVVVGESCPVGRTFVSYGERVASAPPRFTNAATRADDVGVWLFTSGSTGTPRAAVHRHRDFAFNIERYAKRILEISPTDVMLAVPKLFFAYATGMSFMFPFSVGATAILFPERATPALILSLCRRHQATVLTAVPTMLAKMLGARQDGAVSSDARADLRSLRVAVSAGEALPAELYQRWKAAFGVEIMEGLGSAEMFHIFISSRVGDVRPGCLGRLVPGYEARVVIPDDSGGFREAADGEIGALWVRGGSAAAYFEGDNERTRRTLPPQLDGWVVTSDLVKREGGYFYYAGRSDDMLKISGIYVSPLEVENVLLQHPAVAECAVVGYEDGDGLTKLKACVVTRDTLEDELDGLWSELGRFARERLAAYKAPRRWESHTSLPRSDRGKLLRRALR
jgi:benzoate-CoA ligase